MKTHVKHLILGALALAGAACSDLPTAVLTPNEALPAPSFAVLADPIVNGGFETGDFTGWTFAGPLSPSWQVSGLGAGGENGMTPTEPDGTFVAWNKFNGSGPTDFTLYQDVSLPSDNVEISWRYRAQWTSFYAENQPRTADFQIRDPGTGDVLATLHHFDTGTTASGDSGWQAITAAFSGVAGQSVRIYVTAHIEDFFPGVGQLEVDAFAMNALDPPPSEPPPDEGPSADPTHKNDCKKGGWADFGFRNQGQCVRFVQTGKDSR